MPRPLVTALLDTYNHERFIEQAIVSVLSQNFSPTALEILVVDDGSTDRTAEIASKFGPRVRLLSKKNGGQASAFNAGAAEAQGEIICFLDGDDWWAPEKVTRVAQIFAAQPEVGLVGHGITEVLTDGSSRETAAREEVKFSARTPQGAHLFRMRKNFLGSSRMAIRSALLRQILPVPEAIVIEADEYIFTVAAVLADAMVLPEALTFYRHHAANLFMVSDADPAKLQGKLSALQHLVLQLRRKLCEIGIDAKPRDMIMDALEAETTHLRLIVAGGYPWETIATELQLMRIFRQDASPWQQLFTCARLLPAFFLPARIYYKWNQKLSSAAAYREIRQKFFPFPVPGHVRDSGGRE